MSGTRRGWLLGGVLALALGLGPAALPGPRALPPLPLDGAVLVRWRVPAPPPATFGAEARQALQPRPGLEGLGIARYGVPAAGLARLVAQLRADPRVAWAEPDGRYRLLGVPNDALFPEQWNMRQVSAPAGWDLATGGGDVIVALLDSGVDPSHPDLAGRVVAGRNVRERNGNTRDDIGHGTHVAGIVGALGDNGVGVAGLSWGVRLMPIKITDRQGDASISAAADGIRWALDNGARIVNLSFGGLDDSQAVRAAIQDARARGALLVAAAGNCGEVATYRDEGCDRLNPPIFPAALSDVIAVGALGANGEVAPYSETGDYVRLTAPGGVGGSNRTNGLDYILSTWPPGLPSPIERPGYSLEVGTSMAAPHVAGVAALVWSANPTLTAGQVETLLFETADDLGPPGRDERYGYGRVNAARALERALSLPGARTAQVRIGVDAPAPDSTASSPLVVSGWAVDTTADSGTGIDLVELWLDGPPGAGQPLGRATYGLARQDVARLLDRGGFAAAGFSVRVDVPSGAHTLWLRAHSSLSGVWASIPLRLLVAPPQVPVPRT